MDIPFSVKHEGKMIRGFLSAPNGAGGGMDGYPTIFHVMVQDRNRWGRAKGSYYWGQLMWSAYTKDWWLPDSALQPYTDYLGAVVQQWYE